MVAGKACIIRLSPQGELSAKLTERAKWLATPTHLNYSFFIIT